MAPPFYFKTSSGASPRRAFFLLLFSLLFQRQVLPATGAVCEEYVIIEIFLMYLFCFLRKNMAVKCF